MSSRVVYWNGRFVAERDARISIYDSALTAGDMAFEVTRTFRHRPFRLHEHLARLEATLEAIRIDPGLSREELLRATEETLARNLPTEAEDVDWNIIHNISRGPAAGFAEAFEPDQFRPTILISCFPLFRKLARLAPKYDEGIDLVVPQQRALPTDLMHAHIKTRSRLHYQLANFEAEAKSPGSTAVLADPDGYLTEGTSGNFFLVADGRLQTPEPRNLLPGVTRGLVLECADRLQIPRIETNLSIDDAQAADEAFLSSTSIGILHARSFEGRALGDGRMGPVTRRLREALTEAFGLDIAQQAQQYAARIAQDES